MDKRFVKKQALVAFLFITSVFILLSCIAEKIVISWGGSVPYRVFLKSDSLPKKGDYVVLATSGDDKFARGKVIIKRVMCTEGEVLKIGQLNYYCCKSETDELYKCTYLGKAKLHSITGEPVIPFNPCGTTPVCVVRIPEGKYFVVNDHIDSYDSRYFGFVSQHGSYKILYTAKPLF